jgi:hypothetical protein
MNEHGRHIAQGAFLGESAPTSSGERGVILEELQGRFDRRVMAGTQRI